MTENSASGDGVAPTGVALRELRESDAESVAALYRLVFGDQRPIDAAEIVSYSEVQRSREN